MSTGKIGIYHPPAGAPFHVGAIVKVIGGDKTVDTFVGEIGTIDHYDYDSNVGQTVPDNPLLIVRFFGGQRQGFWPEELVEMVQKPPADLIALLSRIEEVADSDLDCPFCGVVGDHAHWVDCLVSESRRVLATIQNKVS